MKTISISSSAVLALCAALSLIPSPVLRAADEALPPSKPQSDEAQAPRLVSLVLLLSEAPHTGCCRSRQSGVAR